MIVASLCVPFAVYEPPDEEEDEPREEELEDEEEEPFELDEPVALAASFAEAAAEALIYFAPFPMRPSRWSMTASCSRVSGACGAEPSVIPASVSAFQASAAQALAFLPSLSFS